MLPDRVSNPGPLTCESGALLIALRGPACFPEQLTNCILVDSSTVVCWISPFVILRVSVYFVAFILFFMEKPVSKHCRP